MKGWYLGLGVAVLLLGGCATAPSQPTLVAAQATQTLAPLLPMRRFVANAERTGGFVLSPNGERLLWSQTVGTDVGLAVRPVADTQAVRSYATGNQGRGGGYYNWLPNSRHVVFSKDERGDENTQLRVFDAQAVDLQLWQVTPARGVRAWVVSRGPAGSARFFFASNERDRSTFDLYQADATTRQVTEVARSDGGVLDWVVGTDARTVGRIRQLGKDDGSGAALELRDLPGGWRTLKTWGGFDSFRVLRVDPALGKLWALSNLGRDKAALVEMDTASGAERVLAEHAVVDVAQASFASVSGPPVGYVVEPDHPQMHFFEGAWKAQMDAVVARAVAQGTLPQAPVFTRLQGRDDAARRVLLRSQGQFDAAELLWDRESGAVTRLDTYFPEEAQVLSPVTPMAFTASDGRRIHGYLTRPRGVSGPVPLVVDIHGGPWARDSWAPATFNARQMLANRGYAVLQLNYRGSAGYGRDHMWAGAMEYNGRLQQDIAEGVQWAIDQGVADPRRLAVMGGSFGGFSVLAQLAQKRHDYRCGINVVGVADWPRLIESWPPFWRNRHMFVRFYGDPADPAQRAAMLRNSPVSYLDQISAPLLVVHGANDIRVLRQDSDDVVTALRQRGHPVEYLLFPDEGHSISKWRNRLAMWRTVEDTLATCLGGRSAGFDFYELMPRGR
ncbi:MAG: prolyl oligopeptidase family serine peptidase [Hydrogenophaga sp.]|nr:prolyl oligopeptidase family serine peptidase [Hydrogenophaga sp.]